VVATVKDLTVFGADEIDWRGRSVVNASPLAGSAAISK
jgi:hypothetical protein